MCEGLAEERIRCTECIGYIVCLVQRMGGELSNATFNMSGMLMHSKLPLVYRMDCLHVDDDIKKGLEMMGDE